MRALCTELEYRAATYGALEPVETIYLGGGTPSRLSLDDLARILDTINSHFNTSELGEVTLELNPEDGDIDYLGGLKDIGINRLSIGIQSYYESDLRFMHRSHNSEQAAAVVPLVRKAGFNNFSVDLIFGVPNQPEEYWAANLEKAVGLEAPHLSTYMMTVEPRTVLHKQIERGLIQPVGEEDITDLYEFTIRYLQERGYEHYEISSFAQPGFRAQHNQLYWNHRNYLGFGPSAHSFWWKGLPARRWANVGNLQKYEALLESRQEPLDFSEQLVLDTLANEYIMLRLRTTDGLDLDRLSSRYGVELLVEKVDDLARLESEGYIAPIRNSRVRLTELGKTLCDTVTEHLLIDDEAT